MTRQVNLANKNLLPGFGPVQLPAFLLSLVIALILGVGWILLSVIERQSLLAEESQWIETVEEELDALTRFQKQHPALNNEDQLQKSNQELSNQLQKSRETYSGLANQVENAIEGFNAPLTQLADYDLNGLWLNTISLKDGRRYFSLEGFTRKPELIPQYLEQLGESTFSGITIEQLAVTKEDQQNLWRFTMSNNQATAEPGEQN